ncbi:MAG TPA: efflux RND transporter periplasmic adaptor subunit [Steroidobacteraceae bacterium]|nr:efflux RND transporter periplasmic adaptor subunit [Steroidobacteraceae bacterium]
MKTRTWAAAVAVVAVAALILYAFIGTDEDGSAGSEDSQRPPPTVEAARAEARQVEAEIAVTGSLTSPESVLVTAERPGRVEEVLFEEGEPVAAGDVLIELERSREEAAVEEAEARVAEAQRQLDRQIELERSEFASEARTDEARTALAAARAALRVARENLDAMRIDAPFAGVPGRRLVSPGALIEPGTGITRLVVTDPLDLLFEVPGSQIAGLERGNAVRATSSAYPDRVFSGTVTFIGPEVDPATRTLPVEARVDNSEGLLKPGMFVTGAVISGMRDAVTIPEQALITRGPAEYVYVLDAEDRANRVPVTSGVRREGWIEIERGLETGDRVIVSGLQKVRDGQQTRVAREESGAGSRPERGSASAVP